MIKMTEAQRKALRRVYDRTSLYPSAGKGPQATPVRDHHNPLTFEDFLRYAAPTFGMEGAVTVPWCGMWLCIETDGHVHS